MVKELQQDAFCAQKKVKFFAFVKTGFGEQQQKNVEWSQFVCFFLGEVESGKIESIKLVLAVFCLCLSVLSSDENF